jgi:hypothetical protein
MITRAQLYTVLAIAGVTGGILACSAEETALAPAPASGTANAARLAERDGVTAGPFRFASLSSSTVCSDGGDPIEPLTLPTGFSQITVASEPDFADVPDMNTQNENGHQVGRYLYRVHEVGSNGSLSVTDLQTGLTKIIAQRADWESLDPTVWTPWGTLLFAEESNAAKFRDPEFPDAVAGLVYEVFFDPSDLTVVKTVVARPAIGSKSHEGMRFDSQGNLYSISERTPGYLFKFVPDHKGDLSSGRTYVLKVTNATGDRTGDAQWVLLDREAVKVDASVAADLVQATGYGRPEDVEMVTADAGHGATNYFYVSITSEHRVLRVDLRGERSAFVSEFVSRTTNATPEFAMPDNLALDRGGNLYIAEDPGGNFSSGKRSGDDIWVATPARSAGAPASSVSRFASLTDCEAEPTGIYFDRLSNRLFVNVQHRGGDRLDKTMAIGAASVKTHAR